MTFPKDSPVHNREKGGVLDLAALTFARLIVNMTRRFPYPFLPEISRQLSVPLESVQNVMAVNAGVGIGSPLLGPIGERYGRKRVMMGTLVGMVLASVFGALSSSFAIFAGSMIVYGVVKMVFDPAISAYLGDLIPYERRGRAVGIIELSWAGALLIAAPVTGWLLGASGLQSVFIMLGVLCLGALAAVYRILPADHPEPGTAPRGITPRATWRALRSNPLTFPVLGYGLLRVVANEIFFINYGAYMESSFGLALTALGTVTIVVALAEVAGEFAVIGFADRYGKRRVTLIGAAVSSIGYALLPLFSSSLPMTLAMVFVIFFAFEAAIVASIPLYQEILPDARAIMMSMYTGIGALGRLAGAALGGWLYLSLGDFTAISAIVTVISLASLFLLWRYFHEREQPHPNPSP